MVEKSSEATSESFVTKTQSYFSESMEELKKVQSPTRQEAMRLTWVVLLIIVFISLCLFVVDLFFNWFMSKMMAP